MPMRAEGQIDLPERHLPPAARFAEAAAADPLRREARKGEVVTTIAREWFTADDLAAEALPSMPATKRGVQLLIDSEGWARDPAREGRAWRRRQGRGGGLEYHVSNLGMAAQAVLALRYPAVAARPEASREAARQGIAAAELWDWFDRQPETKKAEARERLETLQAVDALVRGGVGRTVAKRQVAGLRRVTLQTLYNWEKLVAAVPRADWLPYLAPRHAGATAQDAECTPEAWDWLKVDYLRLEQPTFTACYRRLQGEAKKQGWTVPSERTLHRRMSALPAAVLCLAREGEEALKRRYPAQQRDRGVFHALEAVNADGHKWDVFVKWPDGSIGRPMMTAFQDLYSGKLLAWRIDRSESAYAFRLAFGDLVEQWGIPDRIWLDNTRAAANKTMTGGVATRFRFKAKAEEPLGILPTLGVEIHWTLPYSGQSKPIERMFRDFATDTAKHPEFAGAYTGNNPTAKPENYASAAVPLDKFTAVLRAEIAAHNARPGRQGGVCRGRSFDEVFAESYAEAPIRRASAAQRRVWLLAAEAVRVREDGTVHFLGNRYWAESLVGLAGQRVTLRFDPDALHQPMQVYRLDGAYLGEAAVLEAAGFADTEAARQHNRARKDWTRAQKDMLGAERRMSIDQLAAAIAAEEAPAAAPAPAPRVVRPFFGQAVPKEITEEEEEDQAPAEAQLVAALRSQWGGRPRLSVVTDEDADGGV